MHGIFSAWHHLQTKFLATPTRLTPTRPTLELLEARTLLSGNFFANGSWSSCAALSTARDQFAAGVIDGKIYVFGGNGNPDGYNLKTTERFNPSTNSWSYLASNEHNSGYSGVEEVSGAVVNGKLYVFGAWGGTGPTGNYGDFNFVEEYNPATNTWTSKAPKPTLVSSAPSAVYNGEIYVFGGKYTYDIAPDTEGPQVYYQVVEAYNPATNTWRSVTTMPQKLSGEAVAVVGSKVYLIGGMDPDLQQLRTTVQAYDFITGQWTTSGLTPIPQARYYSPNTSAPVVNGMICVVGGVTGTIASNSTLSRVDLYNPVTNVWTTGPSLPAARQGHATVALGNTLYAISGYLDENDINRDQANVWSWQVPNPTTCVTHLYRDVLGRDPDSAGLSHWIAGLENGTITSAQIAAGFINSTEYRANRIRETYQSILGRSADAAGLNSWLNYFASGHTLEQIKAGFYGSTEYFNRKGGTNSSVVTAFYNDILGRAPDSGGLASWTSQLNAGALRSNIAYAIMSGSVEGAARIVRGCYSKYLLREPDPAGLQSWITQVRNGVSELTINIGFLGSTEYQNRS